MQQHMFHSIFLCNGELVAGQRGGQSEAVMGAVCCGICLLYAVCDC